MSKAVICAHDVAICIENPKAPTKNKLTNKKTQQQQQHRTTKWACQVSKIQVNRNNCIPIVQQVNKKKFKNEFIYNIIKNKMLELNLAKDA